jgi:hypothetical protein
MIIASSYHKVGYRWSVFFVFSKQKNNAKAVNGFLSLREFFNYKQKSLNIHSIK